MEKLMTSIISLFLALSILNAKANDVPRQNEDIIANYSLNEDDTLRYSNHYLFERAYNVIGDMLTDKRPVDFKKAVFAVENAFYDGKLDGHNDNLRLWELEDIHYQLKKKAWHKGHKNNNDVMADDELRPERLRLREKELELLRIGYHRFTAAEYAERYSSHTPTTFGINTNQSME
ncbi:MAG: hypothetical protein MJZ93_07270, partial [Paludibacteraceae bacterium]|nr:hypothetical protein [Paludibacteraceae bacterium]